MTRSFKAQALLPAALVATLVACEAKKSSNPLSPSVAGPIAGVDITVPKLLEPAEGFRFRASQQPIKLLIENSSSSGVRPVSYIFEVASDGDFGTKVFARSGVSPGEGGRTSVQIDALELGRTYWWRAKADDGANSSTFATGSFALLPRPVLNPPTALTPVNSAQVAELNPTLKLNNSSRNEAANEPVYLFVVAADQAFTNVVASGTAPEGRPTMWTVNAQLLHSQTYYWHARASDGETTTDWSPTAVFRTPAPPSSGGGGGGGGGPVNPGGPCTGSTGLQIVECERAKYGFMSSSQMLDFMRNVARSLNANGISGAPFGILRKTGGHNCGGYSCDVVCSGTGSSQRQWDVLGDIDGAQTPAWGGPNTVPNIRIDTCSVP